MSMTVTTYPIVDVFVKAEDFLGSNRVWRPQNEMQAYFLQGFFTVCRNEARIPEIESIASWYADEINRFLERRGFSIRLQQFGPDTFGVASVLDLMVEWLRRGVVTKLVAKDENVYPAVRIDKDAVAFFTAHGHNYPIACPRTKSGDVVYITMLDKPLFSGFEFVARAEEITANLRFCHDYGDLIFPMVDLNQEVDISWLMNMETDAADGRRAWVTQALQQTKLRMNEVGARVESAVAVAITLEMMVMPKPPHTIDRPFLIWFTRDGLSKPLFVGYIGYEDWRNPGSISTKE